MSILSLEKISKELQDRRLNVVKEACGVSQPVLLKLRKGVAYNYRIDTLKKVSDYLTKGKTRKKADMLQG